MDDLLPLKKVVGNARIVGLGEATHGTHEFFQLKHRMIELLVSQMGFSVFSIEANMPEAYRLNEYVLKGVGDPKQLIEGMGFWTWDTEEMLEMVRWMHEFNQSGKGKVQFTGFDMQTPDESINIVQTYLLARDPNYLSTASSVYRDVARMSKVAPPNRSAVLTAKFPLKIAAGRHIRFSGYIKAEKLSDGFAGLWWRVDGEEGKSPLAFDNMKDRGAHGTTPWTRYEISMDVPEAAQNIFFGVLQTGSGTAWFDSLQIEVDGKPYNDATAFDLGFESDTLRGFWTGGDFRDISLDTTVARSGKKSLRIQRQEDIAAPDSAKTLANHLLIDRCKEVVKHLQAGRETAGQSIDWVIQNAKLVLEYVGVKAGIKTRDESMAENVEWIAEHNPEAKIVLWAHNGHVAHDEFGVLNRPMGMHLRDYFGDNFINVGLFFNQGSFRGLAVPGKGPQVFVVGPAPAESFDQALASVGEPLFALDLRTPNLLLPQWLNAHHSTRSVGAVYNDQRDDFEYLHRSIPQLFDVIMFVNKTTGSQALK